VRAVEPLSGRLRDESSNIQQQAALWLGRLGDPRAVEPLVVAMHDLERGGWHAFALWDLRAQGGFDALVRFLKNGSAVQRTQAAWILGRKRLSV